MQNIIIKESDTFVSKTLKFPIKQRPKSSHYIRLKPMSFSTLRMINHTEISSLTQTEFDDGNVAFIINIAHVGKKNDKLFCLYRANLNFKIKKDGTMQLLKNGKLVTIGTEIREFLDLFYRASKKYPNVFDKLRDKSFNLYDYYLSRNKKLFQLPCNRIFLENYYYSLDNNTRNKVNYHLRKGNTHKATISLLGYDFPKSIRKLLLKDYNHISTTIKAKQALLAGIPVDVVRNLILQERSQLLNLLAMKPTLTGWSINERPQTIKLDPNSFYSPLDKYFSEGYARDIVRMLVTASLNDLDLDLYISGMPNNIRQFHDELIPVYNRMMDKHKAENWALMNKFHKSEYDVAMINSYTIRPVINSNECVDIGKDMGICVSSYTDSHNKGSVEIIVVTDSNGKYLACLECKDFKLIQAKLKYNQKLSNDKDICNSVIQYCDQFDIKVSTRDVC